MTIAIIAKFTFNDQTPPVAVTIKSIVGVIGSKQLITQPNRKKYTQNSYDKIFKF